MHETVISFQSLLFLIVNGPGKVSAQSDEQFPQKDKTD